MTVSTTTSFITYSGNGSTTLFTFPFIGVSSADIVVTLTVISTGVVTTLTGTQYVLVLNAASIGSLWGIGGTVQYPVSGSPLTAGTNITITRAVPFTQNISISNQGAFYPQTVERGLDLLELQIQQTNNGSSEAFAEAAAASAEAAAASAASVSSTSGIWSRPVLSILGTPPGSPSIGDRYLVSASGTTGVWVGKENNVTEYGSTSVWLYSGTPKINQELQVGTTLYTYSQETYDSGVLWRPSYQAFGGARGLYQPTDEPAAIESINLLTRPTCMASSGYGRAGIFHFNCAAGTPSSPTGPVSGAIIGSTGYRAFDTGTSLFAVSSAAMNVILTENARVGTAYTGCKIVWGTTPNGGSALRTDAVILDQDGALVSLGTAGDTNHSFSTSGSGRWFYGPNTAVGMGIQSDTAITLFQNRCGSDGVTTEFRKTNVTVGNISVTGSATAYNTSSDERLKTPTKEVIDTGKIIDSVSPKEFTWNTTGEKEFGFFAQELRPVVKDVSPNAVHVGSIEDPGDPDFSPWGVDNSKLIPLLWAEVQSLRKRVSDLEKTS